MNLNDLVSEFSQTPEPDRQWAPLITQQLRLRHLTWIQVFNLQSEQRGSFHFTLHLSLTSPPFYTSRKVDFKNPKWSDLYLDGDNGYLSGVVMKIWQTSKTDFKEILSCGVNFSGLVHLGNKVANLHPYYFKSNAVIFFMKNAYFASQQCLRTEATLPFSKYLNLLDNKILYRRIAVKETNVQPSYSLEKLTTLHNLQLRIKTKKLEVQHVKERIKYATLSDVTCQDTDALTDSTNNIRFAPQLLTMTSLNKMLHEKPTQSQKDEMERKAKEIEKSKFKIRLLEQEKQRKSRIVKQLLDKREKLSDTNEEKNCDLMSRYHTLQKDCERLRDHKRTLVHQRELFMQLSSQLHLRQKQLLKELLFIYPIKKADENKFTILGVSLPNSDVLADYIDNGFSIALGYVTHALVMASVFLNVPLRYPMTHLGSRSVVVDQVSGLLPDKEREFPLFTKGKEKMQFTYGVYLLNKNLAQLRWLVHMNTPDLKATLPNLLQFLQGNRDYRPHSPVLSSLLAFTFDESPKPSTDSEMSMNRMWTSRSSSGLATSMNDSLLDSLKQEGTSNFTNFTRQWDRAGAKTCKSRHCGRGISDILAIPEAYLSNQISPNSLQKYVASRKPEVGSDKNDDSCDSECSYKTIKVNRGIEEPAGRGGRARFDSSHSDSIEQGTDPLDPNVDLSSVITKSIAIHSDCRRSSTKSSDSDVWQNRRLSRSAGSYPDNGNENFRQNECFGGVSMEIGSDPILLRPNYDDTTSNSLTDLTIPSTPVGESEEESLEKWLDSGTELIANEESLNPSWDDLSSPLTARTDRLLSFTSFNLVKPKM